MKFAIMAGGQGTRFWPLSRERRPKQFLAIAGTRTMLQETVCRLSPLARPDDVYVVCGRQYVELVRDQLPDLGPEQLVVEPVPRNTAPCIGLAALHLRRMVGDSVMAVLPADHSIGRVEEFHAVLEQAAKLAEQGWMVTFGIEPTFPATGYGYIQRAEQIGEAKGRRSFKVARFAEKPRLEQAAEFLASGEYYWNSGMFVWTVGTIMEQFRQHMPELHEILLEIDADWDNAEKREELFSRAPRVSIDFGVMEKAERVATIPCALAWNDVGNWRAVEDLLCEDERGIAANTRYVQWESRDCLAHSASGKLVALVGVQDLIVVETPDVVLVCRKDKSEDVKQIVEELRRNGPAEYL
ncbi:MAG: mannose-1-phosphate guanylyltransferase [Acidobacteria bacterium]|nr:MAG: mannose-1-phosphate guanylyltransferase [Acidobacteriota bacterium]